MSKEELLKLGLSEELAEKTAKAWADAQADVLKGYVPQADYTAQETRLNSLETAVKGLVKDAKGSTMEEKINDFQQSVQAAKVDLEKELRETRTAAAIKLELAGKVHDYDLVAGQIDTEKLVFDKTGGVAAGLKEQIESLKKDKAFLFVPEKSDTPILNGFKPADGKEHKPTSDNKVVEFAKSLASGSKSEAATAASSYYFKN